MATRQNMVRLATCRCRVTLFQMESTPNFQNVFNKLTDFANKTTSKEWIKRFRFWHKTFGKRHMLQPLVGCISVRRGPPGFSGSPVGYGAVAAESFANTSNFSSWIGNFLWGHRAAAFFTAPFGLDVNCYFCLLGLVVFCLFEFSSIFAHNLFWSLEWCARKQKPLFKIALLLSVGSLHWQAVLGKRQCKCLRLNLIFFSTICLCG